MAIPVQSTGLRFCILPVKKHDLIKQIALTGYLLHQKQSKRRGQYCKAKKKKKELFHRGHIIVPVHPLVVICQALVLHFINHDYLHTSQPYHSLKMCRSYVLCFRPYCSGKIKENQDSAGDRRHLYTMKVLYSVVCRLFFKSSSNCFKSVSCSC